MQEIFKSRNVCYFVVVILNLTDQCSLFITVRHQWGWPLTEIRTVTNVLDLWWTSNFANAFVFPGVNKDNWTGRCCWMLYPLNLTQFMDKFLPFAGSPDKHNHKRSFSSVILQRYYRPRYVTFHNSVRSGTSSSFCSWLIYNMTQSYIPSRNQCVGKRASPSKLLCSVWNLEYNMIKTSNKFIKLSSTFLKLFYYLKNAKESVNEYLMKVSLSQGLSWHTQWCKKVRASIESIIVRKCCNETHSSLP